MKFSADACITCGIKLRSRFTSDYNHRNFITDDRGTLCNTLFWFCSERCIATAFDSLLEKRFQGDRGPYDDPNLPNHHIEEFAQEWQQEYDAALKHALITIRNRAIGESKALKEKELKQRQADEQKELERAKKEEQQRLDREKKEKRQGFFDTLRLEDRDRAIRRQQQQDEDRRAMLELRKAFDIKRDAYMDERREWTIEDRTERRRMQAKNEEWNDQSREWTLEQRDRSERDRNEGEQRERFERDYEQANFEITYAAQQDIYTPKRIPPSFRFEHIHILAPTGAGKTTLETDILLNDWQTYGREAAHIVIDPKGSLIDRLGSLSVRPRTS
jgi:flagellar biosynthesis GTPase FlhF